MYKIYYYLVCTSVRTFTVSTEENVISFKKRTGYDNVKELDKFEYEAWNQSNDFII